MASDPRYTPNPLRPYYIPPSIGSETHPIPNATATTNQRSTSSSSFSFPDLDYSDYIPDASPSIAGTIKTVLDKAAWKYTSVVMAQPFEIAKLILQVRIAQDDDGEPGKTHLPLAGAGESEDEQDSDDDEPNYFTSTTPFSQASPGASSSRGRSGRPRTTKQPSHTSQPPPSPESLQLKNPHSLLEVLSSLSSTESPLAIWKATNSTFIYNILIRTSETFLRSFFAAVVGIADTEVLLNTSSSLPDTMILNSTSPLATVLIFTFSSAVSAIILSPIDTARTRLILTPSSQGPRSLLGALKTLSPSWLIPSHLIPITFLTSTIPTLIASSTPLFLKTYLSLDPVVNPTSWSIFTFLGSALDLSIKFPLETILRRAQIATWTSPALSKYPSTSRTRKSKRSPTFQPLETVVPAPQSYPGILPTIWQIMREEGYSESQKDRTAALMGKAPRRRRKGQGFEGLYRGWRVGLWGLVGIWGSSFVGGLQGGIQAEVGVEGGASVHGGKF